MFNPKEKRVNESVPDQKYIYIVQQRQKVKKSLQERRVSRKDIRVRKDFPRVHEFVVNLGVKRHFRTGGNRRPCERRGLVSIDNKTNPIQ